MLEIVIRILVISFNFIFGRGLHILGYEYIFRIVLGWGFLTVLWLIIMLSFLIIFLL